MEEHSHDVKIYKDGDLVATASNVRRVNVPLEWDSNPSRPHRSDPSDGVEEALRIVIFECFHLPRIKLERMVVFRVLNKLPLSSIFNDSGIEIDGERIEPVYYVNGLVETIRGNPNITAVVLAKPNVPVDTREFAKRLPELYKRFSALL